jgi:hypothetical protein
MHLTATFSEPLENIQKSFRRVQHEKSFLYANIILKQIHKNSYIGIVAPYVSFDTSNFWKCEHGNETSGLIKRGYVLATEVTISFLRRSPMHRIILT